MKATDRFSIDPALPLANGTFPTPEGLPLFGGIGDTSPDSWGRCLMRRAEQRLVERDDLQVRTLGELQTSWGYLSALGLAPSEHL